MDPAAEPPDSELSPYSAVWMWEIKHRSGRIKDKGSFVGWIGSQAGAIADEQMALLVRDVAPRYHLLRGLVCRAWREDDPDGGGESRGDDWYATHQRGQIRREVARRRPTNPWPPGARTPDDTWV